MKRNIAIRYNRIREQLWFRPFTLCLITVGGALIAHQADGTRLEDLVPDINTDSVNNLLNILSASMLVISVFAVASMLSAFSAASTTATPRSFKIVVTDDVSQNALSVFIGAYIFSIVATVALNNGYYGKAGKFVLFLLTLLLFAVVILTFLRWVDRISRLGRMEHTIKQIEAVASKALSTYIRCPFLNALPISGTFPDRHAVISKSVGYVQHINMEALQVLANNKELIIRLNCIPGKFVDKNFPIAFFSPDQEPDVEEISQRINDAFRVGNTRIFDEDPRFGLIALTEIASRALSPGINDPGTAIQIIGSHVKLFFLWKDEVENGNETKVVYDRIQVPQIPVEDFFNDAFRPISRDGAGNIEVMLRLQKALRSIETIEHEALKKAAVRCSEEAYGRAELNIEFKHDLDLLKRECLFYFRSGEDD